MTIHHLRPVVLDHIHTTVINGQREPSKRVSDWLATMRYGHRIEHDGNDCLIYLDDEDDCLAAHLMFM